MEETQKTTKKIAVVTGASRGIGRAVALELAKAGALVVVNYSGSEEKAEETRQMICEAGGEAVIRQCNVADFEATGEFIGGVIKEFGRIDILVNNAGVTKDGLLMRMKEADFDRVIDINLKGAFNCIRHAAGQMIRQRGGRIVNLSSVVGLNGNAGQANYAASKAGVIGLTKSAAKELASRGITVNAVAPGFINTDMTQALSERVRDEILKQIPMGAYGEPEDVAKLVAFLASDDARYITGQVISIDGGMA
ncbi:MAG: 3-oxoacyl-[acyl-carrier-protein] reductase [Lachnospiraceae bacterium]|nr:3-oxoacyl-[acyl-carrier-protein] reductase [Lachnospiraceae bacterium]